ncbi:MAG TPA: MoxR family ATPase [Eubacteriales bacterium]|nr:MoxR family ATPase [Eubacteriales bacterium]
MNIQQAKDQIKSAMRAYFTKDEFGSYVIPIEKQRPIFLMGPPGIGKTAIMEQIAQELGVGLVSYSMTHHTRQSALGLPFIEHKIYGGKEYAVSEYTMSEIIASVYNMMEETGLKEGILFLDEINCVSETLAPTMLQFLQYKIFGRHRVPEGWIVVTAGNPPEYNASVREFDIVTWDRLKRIDVEPDFNAWKEYARNAGVHPAILTYLEIKMNDFYRIETTVDGKTFVTARGWSDLSEMIRLFEKNNEKVDEKLVRQYLQNPKIAKEFAVYYDLFNKYRSDYQVDRIVEGKEDATILQRAKAAKFDERLALLGLLLDVIEDNVRTVAREEMALIRLKSVITAMRSAITIDDTVTQKQIKAIDREITNGKAAGTMSDEQFYALHRVITVLEEIETQLKIDQPDRDAAQTLLKKDYDKRVKAFKTQADETGASLSHVFRFCEKAFDEGQEMLILVTELTISKYASRFISRYGCPEYFAHNKELLFYERQMDLIAELSVLE